MRYLLSNYTVNVLAEKLIIIGAGPAGLSAAIYASREGFEPLVIGGMGGGQLELTSVVENYPGFPEGIDGPKLISELKRQAEHFGARFVYEFVNKVDFNTKPYKIFTDGNTYEADAIIIATGADARWLGIESEKRFRGKGVSSCATCDGAFFKGASVIVVGGGDTAMEDSLFLTRFAKSVTVVHRKNEFRASRIMQERVLHNDKINVIWNSTVEEIKGDSRVNGVVLKNALTGQTQELKIDGVFIAIGYTPNTKPFAGSLPLDEQGYIITKDEVLVDRKDGIFIAGDVADHYYRQAATASGSGVKCAIRAREYLSNLYYEKKEGSGSSESAH